MGCSPQMLRFALAEPRNLTQLQRCPVLRRLVHAAEPRASRRSLAARPAKSIGPRLQTRSDVGVVRERRDHTVACTWNLSAQLRRVELDAGLLHSVFRFFKELND